MKIRAYLVAAAVLVSMSGSSFAFDSVSGMRSQNLVTKVTCDVRNEDEQALCAAKCDDYFVRNSQNNMTDHVQLKAEKKACDEKCGCPQNSK